VITLRKRRNPNRSAFDLLKRAAESILDVKQINNDAIARAKTDPVEEFLPMTH
jgi:hypothetical protein